MLITTNAIIIRERPVGENDKYIEILSDTLGIIEVSAKGARKITGSNTAGTQLYTYSKLCINKTQRGYYLNSSQVINTFYNIRFDIKKLSLVAYLSDLLRYTTPPEEPANIILRLFLNTLHYLNGDERDIEQLKVIFELRLACEIGLMPQLIGCKECYLSSSDKMYFNLYEGNLICENCLTGDELAKSLPLDKTMLHIIRYICLSDFNKIFNFKITEKYQKKVSLVSEKYLKIQLSRYFKSLEFYENI